MPRKPKPAAPGSAPDIESMIRVDHAGEYGAVRIYEGQLAVLRRRRDAAASVETIEHMAAQEQRHLKAFDKLVNERRVRPTALEPVWRVAGFALGAATAAFNGIAMNTNSTTALSPRLIFVDMKQYLPIYQVDH